ncbi:hypothetical protein JCM16814_04680 [Desulfobaculum senezii]
MSELEKGDSFSEFVRLRYLNATGVVLLIVVVFIVRFELAVLGLETDFWDGMDSASFYISFCVILTNIAFAFVNLQGQWIKSFPNYMEVIFKRNNVELEKFGTNGNPIPVVCEADVRSLAQQFGKSKNEDKNLPLKVEYDVQNEVDMKNRQKLYTVTMCLRPPKPEDTSDMKKTKTNVEFNSPDLGGKVGIEIKSEVRISPESAS